MIPFCNIGNYTLKGVGQGSASFAFSSIVITTSNAKYSSITIYGSIWNARYERHDMEKLHEQYVMLYGFLQGYKTRELYDSPASTEITAKNLFGKREDER